MRTIEVNLYQFSELNEKARKFAIDSLRERSVEVNSDMDWSDANDCMEKVKEIANVRVSIQQSSQGFYADHYHCNYEEYELTDKEQFENFRKCYLDYYTEDMWCDTTMHKIVREWTFDERRSYASNVAWMLVDFCEQIWRSTLDYYDDVSVIEWIDAQCFEFTEEGKVYYQ